MAERFPLSRAVKRFANPLSAGVPRVKKLPFVRNSLRVSAFLLALTLSNLAEASWLDSDYWCRVYGCVVASDGRAWDIYDVYNFSNGRTVSPGSPLIAWSNNPHQGSGVVDAVNTGTIEPVTGPGANQGLMIGIDQNADGAEDLSVNDNAASGYLDLGDSLSAFTLSPATDIVIKDGVLQHSFYVASRTDFYIYGRAQAQVQSGQLASKVSPDDTGLAISMVRQGNDSGFSFGGNTTDPRFRPISGVDSLQDIWGTPTRIAEFRRSGGTRSGNARDVSTQSVRVDVEYELPDPDFSYGTGSLNYRVEYLFYNR